MITLGRRQHIGLQLIILLALIFNWQFLHWPIFGILASFLFLGFNSKKLGDILFPKIIGPFKNTLGFLIILLYVSFVYTAFYQIFKINAATFLFTLITLPLIIEFWSWRLNRQHYFFANLDLPEFRIANIKNLIVPTAFLATELLLFILLFRRASANIIRSPWELLDYKFWTLVVIATCLLIFTIFYNKKSNKSIFLIAIHFFLLSSIALILYPLGFGYDPFLHQSTMKVIADTGTIDPRLFFYLGQYGWTFFIQGLWQLPMFTVNKLILPVAFSLLWPHSLYYGLRYGLRWSQKISLVSVLLSLFAGFNFAIMTTPQNLTFLLVAVFIFLLPVIKKRKEYVYLGLALGIGVSTIHPLGGIPILYMTLLMAIKYWKLKKAHKKVAYTIALIISALSLPSLLAIYQRLTHHTWSQIFTWHPWPLFDLQWPQFFSSYSFPLDLMHNIWANYFWIFIILVALGIWLIITKHKYLFFKKHFIFAALLTANYVIARLFISFSEQIDYEKNAYLLRIAYLIGLSLLPIFLTTWYFWWQTFLEKNNHRIHKVWLAALIILIIITSTYFSYPVYDRHQNSKSFNVTQTDLETVELIEQSANQENYIVLANQMVGAAAIQKLGFAHYYNDNFYYSMPLGTDNIYQNYLIMIEAEASRQEAIKAMNKADVDKLYLVINHYWHSAKTAINQANQSADDYFVVDNKNHVFIYNR
jgi:hypothetical protein